MYHDIPESLRALIEPVVATRSNWSPPNSRQVVRVVIDTHDAMAGSRSTNAPVSRTGELFRRRAAMPGAYTLEVSSPGSTACSPRKGFQRCCGGSEDRDAPAIDGAAVSAANSSPSRRSRAVRVDGKPIEIPFDEVSKRTRSITSPARLRQEEQELGEAR